MKSRPRRDTEEWQDVMEHAELGAPPVSTPPLHNSDPIALFPTMGQPISDVTLKDMLLSLSTSLQANMIASLQQCRAEVREIADRVHHVENKMCEITSSFNSLVDF